MNTELHTTIMHLMALPYEMQDNQVLFANEKDLLAYQTALSGLEKAAEDEQKTLDKLNEK